MPIGKKQQLKNQHEGKLMELYNAYYKKALDGDNQAFKPFIDVSKELFTDGEQNELLKILNNTKVGDNE